MQNFRLIAFGLLLAFACVASCAADRTPLQPQRPQSAGASSSAYMASATELRAQAQDALAKQDYARCANRFAAAAKASSDDQAATCWYRAAQCAAREGDYQQSGFHMQAAASAGFANLSRLRADPLLRPLHSGPRWMLIDDAVIQNQIDRSPRQQELTECQVSVAAYRQEQLAPGLVQTW